MSTALLLIFHSVVYDPSSTLIICLAWHCEVGKYRADRFYLFCVLEERTKLCFRGGGEDIVHDDRYYNDGAVNGRIGDGLRRWIVGIC